MQLNLRLAAPRASALRAVTTDRISESAVFVLRRGRLRRRARESKALSNTSRSSSPCAGASESSCPLDLPRPPAALVTPPCARRRRPPKRDVLVLALHQVSQARAARRP